MGPGQPRLGPQPPRQIMTTTRNGFLVHSRMGRRTSAHRISKLNFGAGWPACVGFVNRTRLLPTVPQCPGMAVRLRTCAKKGGYAATDGRQRAARLKDPRLTYKFDKVGVETIGGGRK